MRAAHESSPCCRRPPPAAPRRGGWPPGQSPRRSSIREFSLKLSSCVQCLFSLVGGLYKVEASSVKCLYILKWPRSWLGGHGQTIVPVTCVGPGTGLPCGASPDSCASSVTDRWSSDSVIVLTPVYT